MVQNIQSHPKERNAGIVRPYWTKVKPKPTGQTLNSRAPSLVPGPLVSKDST